MKVARRQFGTLILLLGCAGAQQAGSPPAILQDILVAQQGEDTRVEAVLSSPVQASVAVARHPDRMILKLSNTVDGMKRSKIQVSTNGLRTIRTETSKNTNVEIVIELDRAHLYALSSDNGHIVVTLRGSSQKRRSEAAMVAARRGPLGGVLHRQKNSEPAESNGPTGAPPAAATAGVFSKDRQSQSSSENPSTAATSGSVATGTVHPTNPSVQTSGGHPSITAQATAPNVTQHFGLGNVQAAGSAATPPAASAQPVSTALPATAPTTDNAPRVSAETDATPSAQTGGSAEPNTPALALRAAEPSLRTAFTVKYVAEGVAYLDGGRSSGLKEGVKLEVEETELPARDGTAVAPSDPRVVAELEVTAVAETSAVTDIHSPKRPVKPGDLAYLSSADSEALVQETALSPTRKYPAVVSFTSDDPQDEEAREEIPRPPLPSVNRARGRIGFDYMGTIAHGANGFSSSDFGMMFRGDITRINGTFWNLSGYWRGRFNSQSPQGGQTIQDLINRTYHLSMTYDNPTSAWVAGFGRLYLPWASSLDTIDGGYFGRKLSGTATLGIFGGSTPDPTSYDYSPNRETGGAFLNFTGGDFAKVHYSSTMGAGLSMLRWQPDRPFGFLENTISYAQRVSLYDALQVDSPSGNAAVAAPGAGLSRNFFTLRVQPHPRLELDFNHTYFRDIPTFDPALIGTGLLDKYLFQGFSVGARVEVMKQVSVYTQLGRSNRTGDARSSLNQLYGVTFTHLPWYGLRADVHYANFNSSFGSGSYKALSLSRTFAEQMQVELLTGEQSFNSLMTHQNHSWFVTSRIETNLGSHYFVQGNYTVNRGEMNYDQWMFTLGFRFDSKGVHRK